MIPSLIIIVALVITGLVLYVHHRLTTDRSETADTGDAKAGQVAAENGGAGRAAAGDAEAVAAADGDAPARPEGCCGLHEVCEKAADAAIDQNYYYDDEELDAYAGYDPQTYTEAQTDQFRDVLYTLQRNEIGAWMQALEHRNIPLPPPLRDEVILLLREL